MTSILEYNQEEEEKKLRMAEHQAGYNTALVQIINNYISKKNVSLKEAYDTLGVSLEGKRIVSGYTRSLALTEFANL